MSGILVGVWKLIIVRRIDADLTHNQAVVDMLGSKERIRRYQANPANWGPLSKPASNPQQKMQVKEATDRSAEKLDDAGDLSGDKNVGEKHAIEHTDNAHTTKKTKIDV